MPHVQVGGILGGIALPPVLLHEIPPEQVPSSWLYTSLQTDCVNGILMMTHCVPFRANIASWIVVQWSCENILVPVSTLMDTGLTLTCHMADSPYGKLLRQSPEVAHPQCRDIAPLRLVSWVSCEVPARVQQVLNQLMILFGCSHPGVIK